MFTKQRTVLFYSNTCIFRTSDDVLQPKRIFKIKYLSFAILKLLYWINRCEFQSASETIVIRWGLMPSMFLCITFMHFMSILSCFMTWASLRHSTAVWNRVIYIVARTLYRITRPKNTQTNDHSLIYKQFWLLCIPLITTAMLNMTNFLNR